MTRRDYSFPILPHVNPFQLNPIQFLLAKPHTFEKTLFLWFPRTTLIILRQRCKTSLNGILYCVNKYSTKYNFWTLFALFLSMCWTVYGQLFLLNRDNCSNVIIRLNIDHHSAMAAWKAHTLRSGFGHLGCSRKGRQKKRLRDDLTVLYKEEGKWRGR